MVYVSEAPMPQFVLCHLYNSSLCKHFCNDHNELILSLLDQLLDDILIRQFISKSCRNALHHEPLFYAVALCVMLSILVSALKNCPQLLAS